VIVIVCAVVSVVSSVSDAEENESARIAEEMVFAMMRLVGREKRNVRASDHDAAPQQAVSSALAPCPS